METETKFRRRERDAQEISKVCHEGDMAKLKKEHETEIAAIKKEHDREMYAMRRKFDLFKAKLAVVQDAAKTRSKETAEHLWSKMSDIRAPASGAGTLGREGGNEGSRKRTHEPEDKSIESVKRAKGDQLGGENADGEKA